MIKGSGKLNKETYESLLKQGISAEDIRKGEKNLRLVAHQTPGAKEYGLSWAMQLHFEGNCVGLPSDGMLGRSFERRGGPGMKNEKAHRLRARYSLEAIEECARRAERTGKV